VALARRGLVRTATGASDMLPVQLAQDVEDMQRVPSIGLPPELPAGRAAPSGYSPQAIASLRPPAIPVSPRSPVRASPRRNKESASASVSPMGIHSVDWLRPTGKGAPWAEMADKGELGGCWSMVCSPLGRVAGGSAPAKRAVSRHASINPTAIEMAPTLGSPRAAAHWPGGAPGAHSTAADSQLYPLVFGVGPAMEKVSSTLNPGGADARFAGMFPPNADGAFERGARATHAQSAHGVVHGGARAGPATARDALAPRGRWTRPCGKPTQPWAALPSDRVFLRAMREAAGGDDFRLFCPPALSLPAHTGGGGGGASGAVTARGRLQNVGARPGGAHGLLDGAPASRGGSRGGPGPAPHSAVWEPRRRSPQGDEAPRRTIAPLLRATGACRARTPLLQRSAAERAAAHTAAAAEAAPDADAVPARAPSGLGDDHPFRARSCARELYAAPPPLPPVLTGRVSSLLPY